MTSLKRSKAPPLNYQRKSGFPLPKASYHRHGTAPLAGPLHGLLMQKRKRSPLSPRIQTRVYQVKTTPTSTKNFVFYFQND